MVLELFVSSARTTPPTQKRVDKKADKNALEKRHDLLFIRSVSVAEIQGKGKLHEMSLNSTSFRPKMFKGGSCDTNAYLLDCPEGCMLIDAPEGALEAFKHEKIGLLFLTHGHFDHVLDAAKLAKQHRCPVVMHPTTELMLSDRNLLKKFGIDLEVEPVKADRLILEGARQSFLGQVFDIFEVPGHCPGSLCIFDAGRRILYGGDVLFAGGVGRWDLPGGNRDQLLSGIKGKLLSLPEDTVVYSGHGPHTTIGQEKLHNPYLQD